MFTECIQDQFQKDCTSKHVGPIIKVKGKVFYGLEPPSGESTTTECGVNYYQLLAVIKKNQKAAKWGTPSSSQPQPATDNGVRDGRSN